MGEASHAPYNESEAAETYRDWYSCSLHKLMAEHTSWQYFGDLKGKRIVDFGCGNGAWLKKCLAMGAESCLGLDLNAPMIDARKQSVTEVEKIKQQRLRFAIHNCFQPIEQGYGQNFDFAVCFYVLHYAESEEAVQIFFKNALELLKPGGHLFVGQGPYVANTARDQEIVANLCGALPALRRQSRRSSTVYFDDLPAFLPSRLSVSETGRPFTREAAFTFSDYNWPKKKVDSKFGESRLRRYHVAAAGYSRRSGRRREGTNRKLGGAVYLYRCSEAFVIVVSFFFCISLRKHLP